MNRTMRVITLRWLTALCAVTLLVGCGGDAAVPDDQFYRLNVSAEVESLPILYSGGLFVRPFDAGALLGQRPILFADAGAPDRLRQYSYHYWSDTPPRHLQEFAIDYLRRRKLFDLVYPPELGADARYELLGRIRRLEHIRSASAPGETGARTSDKVALGLELVLRDVDRGKIVSMQSLSEEVALLAPNRADEVTAHGASLNVATRELARAFESGAREIHRIIGQAQRGKTLTARITAARELRFPGLYNPLIGRPALPHRTLV